MNKIYHKECESSLDYSLPDYLGDVKKILHTRASVLPSTKYLDVDTVMCSGVVCYEVVYLDSEGEISSTSFTSDYDLAVKCNGEKYIDSSVETKLQNYSLRLVGPRKFQTKSQVEATVTVSENGEYKIEGDAFESGTVEKAATRVRIKCSHFIKSGEREYAEEVAVLEGAIADEVTVLDTEIEVRPISTTPMDDSYEVKGEFIIKALVKNGEEMPRVLERVVPFSEIVVNDDIDSEDTVRTTVNILSKKANVNALDDGVSVVVSFIAETELCVIENEDAEVVRDCFMTNAEVSNEYGDFCYTELLGMKSISEKFNTELPLADAEAENIRNIVFVSATPKLISAEGQGKTVTVTGEIRFSAIACEINEDNLISYVPLKFDVPFAVNVNYDSQIPAGARFDIKLRSIDNELLLDESKLYPSSTLLIDTLVLMDKRERCISSSFIESELEEKSPSLITVYYPLASDSLFEVAKKFHTPPMKIAQDNSLTESVFLSLNEKGGLSGVPKLIIKG